MIFNDFGQFLMMIDVFFTIFDDLKWLLSTYYDHFWWFLMTFVSFWWFVMIFDDSCQLIMIIFDDFWWLLSTNLWFWRFTPILFYSRSRIRHIYRPLGSIDHCWNIRITFIYDIRIQPMFVPSGLDESAPIQQQQRNCSSIQNSSIRCTRYSGEQTQNR